MVGRRNCKVIRTNMEKKGDIKNEMEVQCGEAMWIELDDLTIKGNKGN